MADKRAWVNRLRVTALVAATTVILGGCARTPSAADREPAGVAISEIEAQRAELALQKAELARREEALAQRQMQLEAQALRATESSADTQSDEAGEGSGQIPPDATPGECYAQVIIPAKFKLTVLEEERAQSERIVITPARYETVEEDVEIKPSETKLEVVPAVYETVEERVMVKPATTRLEVVPAVFETITEEVEVKPAVTRIEEIPAIYETRTKEVIDEPAHREWRYVTDIEAGGGAVTPAGAIQMVQRYGDYKVLETRVKDTGVMCLVEIPATYKTIEWTELVKPAETREVTVSPAIKKTVEKTVLRQAATTREVTIPAEYKTIQKTVLRKPATTREVKIPAILGKVEVTKLVEPARESRVPVPAEVTKRTVKEKVRDARIEWRPVLCKVNMTRENVGALQAALNAKSVGRRCQVDGLIGPCTLDAVRRFAITNGLGWGQNYVTMDVIRELGLDFSPDAPGTGT